LRKEIQGHAGYVRFFREIGLGVRDISGLLPVLTALHLDTEGLYPEVAIIAYHFHWSRFECMYMSRSERHRWIRQIERINKEIADSMKPKGKR